MVPGAYFLLVRNLAVGLLCPVSLVRGTYSEAIEIYQIVSELVCLGTGLPASRASGKLELDEGASSLGYQARSVYIARVSPALVQPGTS